MVSAGMIFLYFYPVSTDLFKAIVQLNLIIQVE